MAEQRGLFGSLIAPTKIKTGAPEIDDAQSELLTRLAGGDISGTLSGGDKLIALGALLKSVSRGSKTSPQEVLQNLQQSKMQEMQTKIQLAQLKADQQRKAQLKPIYEQATPGTGGGPTGQPRNPTPADLFALSAQALALGDVEGAKALREQAAGIAQYTPQGTLESGFAKTIASNPYTLVDGIDPITQRPTKMPLYRAEGYPTAEAWVMSQVPGGGANAAAPTGAAPTGAAPTGGMPSNIPAGSPLRPVSGAYATDLSEGEKGLIQARTEQFKNLINEAQTNAVSAQKRLPQVQALDALSQAIATGKLAEYKNAAQSWINAFGLSNDPNAQAAVSNAAAFTDLRKQMLVQRMVDQKGPQTERDVALLGSIGPQMTNTPAGNKLISASEKAFLRRDIAFNNFLNRYEGKPQLALEAWGKTREGRLGILSDPEFVKAAVGTGAISAYTARDKTNNKTYAVIRTKSGQEFILGEVPQKKRSGAR
jgi:hypothetical protein